MGASASKRKRSPNRASRNNIRASAAEQNPRQSQHGANKSTGQNANKDTALAMIASKTGPTSPVSASANDTTSLTGLSSPMSALHKVYQVLVDCLDPDPVLDKLLQIGFPLTTIRDIREERLTSDKNRKLIEAVRKRGHKAYCNFKISLNQCRQERLYTLLERTEKGENTLDLQRELREKAREQTKLESEHNKLFKDIKEDLITYYRENESQIPAVPLVEEHKVALEDLYVIPPIWAFNIPYHFGPGNIAPLGQKLLDKGATKRQRTTVSRIFLSVDNVRYKKIYITANAGIGKTSLSQKLTMTWCQANCPLESLTEKYENAELEAMKYFDLLFLLHLRDYQSESKCRLDDLITHMVTDNLPRNTRYPKEFLQRLLYEKKCLIIVDGLDEWAHPDKCEKTPAAPHNNYPDSCTVLTTSRPWKLGTIGLSEHNIDRHIEISELDENKREKLEINAVRILNERGLNLAGKDRADFDKEVKSVHIGEIIFVPYILLQLMCLFFGGIPIGESKCEIYSNITEFTLKRGLTKKNLPVINLQPIDNVAVPICMKENETCKLYISLIMKLGKLAFFALFGEKKESSLNFERKVVTQYMTDQEIEFCLKVGLLCQTKDNITIAEKRYRVFFQHKSVQEFFSAIYITSEWENNTVQSTIFNACSSIEHILEMSNMFVFVCGMNHEVYTCISDKLTIVDLNIIRYRSNMYTLSEMSVYWDDMRTMKSYQSMQVQCFQECLRNRNETCSLKLYDIVLDDSLTEDDLTALKTIINLTNGYVKSLEVLFPDAKIGTFVTSLNPGVFTFLETLRVEWCDKEPVWLANTEYALTLKCLTLSGSEKERMFLSDISITELLELKCLQSLCLMYVNITHSNLKRLYIYIRQTTTLTQLKLVVIYCSDHEDQDHEECDVTLNLGRLNELKMLYLFALPCRKLHVIPTCLEKFEFVPHEDMTDRASASLLKDLHTAPVLTSLGLGSMPSSQMIQINHLLTYLHHELQYLKLEAIDMGDVIPLLSTAMTKLERVDLVLVELSSAAWRGLFPSVGQLPRSIIVNLGWITMTSQEWRELLLSVGGMQQTVTVELYRCDGPSRKQWTAIVDNIKSTPTLSLIQELSINNDGEASLTLKKIKRGTLKDIEHDKFENIAGSV